MKAAIKVVTSAVSRIRAAAGAAAPAALLSTFVKDIRHDFTVLAGGVLSRVTRYELISILEINMGDRYGRSDITGISIGTSI